MNPAAISASAAQEFALSGAWTGLGMGGIHRELEAIATPTSAELVLDGARILALDTSGAWVLQGLLRRLSSKGAVVHLRNLPPEFSRLFEMVGQHVAHAPPLQPLKHVGKLETLGRGSVAAWQQAVAMLAFLGEITCSVGQALAHPARIRWRPILFNIRSAGFDALPIVGLLSFLLGIVIVYQGSGQLKLYGANIYVVDLVGLSMLREFAPLMTAIIIAGRSGSAYAAQIGTMAVTEEIDAMRTLGIEPLELLVLPKIMALMIALPLLTVFADVLGVCGGMLMARAQLEVGFGEFFDRFVANVGVSAYLLGIGKAPVFAAIIALVGCFQGFRTRGGADSVGRQTTRSVVQSIFLVIVADAIFSVVFSMLDL